jgi:hypothetical protein
MISEKDLRPQEVLMSAAKPTDTLTPDAGPTYPGGEDAPGYRIAFQAWMLLFLLTICAGLVNFLGSFLKARL